VTQVVDTAKPLGYGLLTFQQESIREILTEGSPQLIGSHVDAVSAFLPHTVELDRELLVRLEECGALECFTVRDTGELVGYAVYTVGPNTHSLGEYKAVQDALYLSPSARRGWAAVKFIKYTADALLGMPLITEVYQSTPLERDFGPVLERAGFKPLERMYVRRQ